MLGRLGGSVDEARDRRQEQHERDREAHISGGLGSVTEDAEAIARKQQTAERLALEQRLDLGAQRLRLALF